jgi:hypothetical protein
VWHVDRSPALSNEEKSSKGPQKCANVRDYHFNGHTWTSTSPTPHLPLVELGPNRDYIIKAASGHLLRRKRCFLRKHVAVSPATNPLAVQIAQTQLIPSVVSLQPNPLAELDIEQDPQQGRRRHPRVYNQAILHSSKPRNVLKRCLA